MSVGEGCRSRAPTEERRRPRGLKGSGSFFFIFNFFKKNILSLIPIGFYLQDVTRLVAPGRMARQIASVAPLHVARQCGHAGSPSQRSAATGMTWPSLSRHISRYMLFTTRFQIQNSFVICSHKCLSDSVAPMIRTLKHILIKKH